MSRRIGPCSSYRERRILGVLASAPPAVTPWRLNALESGVADLVDRNDEEIGQPLSAGCGSLRPVVVAGVKEESNRMVCVERISILLRFRLAVSFLDVALLLQDCG